MVAQYHNGSAFILKLENSGEQVHINEHYIARILVPVAKGAVEPNGVSTKSLGTKHLNRDAQCSRSRGRGCVLSSVRHVYTL